MADTIKIGNLDISSFKVGSDDCKVYLGDTLLYPQSPTPTGSTCYEVISAPMTSYTSTTYDSVYSFADVKWYMLNNMNQYEEYGIYDVVENISSATTYEGKLAIVGETEYQYSGNSWSVVGSYVDSSVTYTIDDTNPSPYVGQELSTTFKIPVSDVKSIGWVDLRIRDNGGDELYIRLNTGGSGIREYRYMGSDFYRGTVTNDSEYFYLSLPSEAPQSIVIENIDYWNSTPIHLIVGSKQATVEYEEKEIPIAKVYNTVADMEAVGCPAVGVGQYGVVSDNIYQFEESEEWVNKAKNSLKLVVKYNDGNANVIECSTSNVLSKGDTQPSYLSYNAMTDAYIGNCVTSIDFQAFYDCTGLTSCTIGSGVTSIGDSAFYQCTSLTSIDIPNSVTSIGTQAFWVCRSLTSITIPDSVTSIGNYAFYNCTGLTSVRINATTPPTLGGSNVFYKANDCPIYVPSASLNAYKNATNWSSYASRIQAIPNS